MKRDSPLMEDPEEIKNESPKAGDSSVTTTKSTKTSSQRTPAEEAEAAAATAAAVEDAVMMSIDEVDIEAAPSMTSINITESMAEGEVGEMMISLSASSDSGNGGENGEVSSAVHTPRQKDCDSKGGKQEKEDATDSLMREGGECKIKEDPDTEMRDDKKPATTIVGVKEERELQSSSHSTVSASSSTVSKNTCTSERDQQRSRQRANSSSQMSQSSSSTKGSSKYSASSSARTGNKKKSNKKQSNSYSNRTAPPPHHRQPHHQGYHHQPQPRYSSGGPRNMPPHHHGPPPPGPPPPHNSHSYGPPPPHSHYPGGPHHPHPGPHAPHGSQGYYQPYPRQGSYPAPPPGQSSTPWTNQPHHQTGPGGPRPHPPPGPHHMQGPPPPHPHPPGHPGGPPHGSHLPPYHAPPPPGAPHPHHQYMPHQQGPPPPHGHGQGGYLPPPPFQGGPPHSHGGPQYSQPNSAPPSSRGGRSGGNSKKSKKVKQEDASSSATISSNTSTTSSTATNRRKRTIDGLDPDSSRHLPFSSSAFVVHRSSSNASTCSTATAGNNTSAETSALTEESPQKKHLLPPRGGTGSAPSSPYQTSFFGRAESHDDEDQRNARRGHRRQNSAASTASSLSIGGLSMTSMGTAHTHEHQRETGGSALDAVVEASPKRRKNHANQTRSTSSTTGSPYKQRSSNSSSSSYHGLRSSASKDSDSGLQGAHPPRPSYICTSHEDESTPSISNTKHQEFQNHHRRVSSSNSSVTNNTRTSRGSSSRTSNENMEDAGSGSGSAGNNLFAVSTSPINHLQTSGTKGITPVTKNTSSSERTGDKENEDSPTGTASRSDPAEFTFGRVRSREDSNSLDDVNERYFDDKKLESHSSSAFARHKRSQSASSVIRRAPSIDGGADTPSLPDIMMNSDDQGSAADIMTDKHLLNRHLRGQSFTPLPHIGSANGNQGDGRSSKNASPTFNPQALSIASQLSWSIAGDTPALGEIADWDDEGRAEDLPSTQKPSPQSAQSSSRHRRAGSAHSGASTPSNRFSPFWPKDEEQSSEIKQTFNSTSSHKRSGSAGNASTGGRGDRDYDSILRLTALTPSSEVADMDTDADLDPLGGKTTPLPIFFDRPQGGSGGEERENRHHRGRSGSPRSRYNDDEGPHSGSTNRMRKGNSYYGNRPGARGSSSSGPPPLSPRHPQHGDPEHIHHMFLTNGGRGPDGSRPMPSPHHSFSSVHPHSSDRVVQHAHHHGSPARTSNDYHGMGSPNHYNHRSPMPVSSSSFDQQRDPDVFSRGDDMRRPIGERREGPPSDFYGSPGGNMFGSSHHHNHVGGPQGDRVRNLRGRGPPSHLAPPSLHIPHHIHSSHHHNLTSPLVGGGGMRWGGLGSPGTPHHHHPHHGHHGPHGHGPHHMHMDLPNSKRKCVSLKPPIPSKFQGDIEKMKTAQVPEFNSLVNFPVHISQKQSMNIPEGMRCCVMCGQACPCSVSNKNKGKGVASKGSSGGVNGKASGGANGVTPLGNNGQASSSAPGKGSNGSGSYAIIPTQNKGLCTLCDVNVWVVVSSGLEIKWCKGCKNFRPWAAFGDKGLATKCVRCRERQREKYALQKEEKEKARIIGKANAGATAKGSTKTIKEES